MGRRLKTGMRVRRSTRIRVPFQKRQAEQSASAADATKPAEATNHHNHNNRGRAIVLAGLALLLILSIVGAVLIRVFDSRGNETLQAISTVLGVLAILVTIAIAIVNSSDNVPQLLRTAGTWIGGSILALALIAAVILILITINRPDVPLSGRIQLVGPTGSSYTSVEVVSGSRVHLQIPGTPPVREELSITPRLAGLVPTADCENPARIDAVLYADGRPIPGFSDVVSGTELRFSLKGIVRDAQVLLVIKLPPEGNLAETCRLRLIVENVFLYT